MNDVLSLSGHEYPVWHVAFSPDGRLAVSSGDGSVRIWSTESGGEIAVLKGDPWGAAAFSSDGRYVVYVSDGKTFRAWELLSAREVDLMAYEENRVRNVAYTPDGHLLSNHEEFIQLSHPATGRRIRRFGGKGLRIINDMAVSRDGRYVFASYGNAPPGDVNASLWEVSSGREIGRFEDYRSGTAVALSSDGARGLIPQGDAVSVVNLDIAISEPERSSLVTRFLPSHSGRVHPLSAVPRFQRHTDFVRTVAYSPDGKCAASGSDDKTVRLWDAVTGNQLFRFNDPVSDVKCVAFSEDGHQVIAGCANGDVLLWKLPTAGIGSTSSTSSDIRSIVPWPMFRQNRKHTGRSSASGPKQPRRKWRVRLANRRKSSGGQEEFHLSSPTLGTGGVVYVGSPDGFLFAIGQRGEIIWECPIPNRNWAGLSSPAVAPDGTLFVGANCGGLHSIGADGTLRWSYATDLVADSSPSIGDDGTIYVGLGKELHAVSPNGSKRWMRRANGRIISSPAIGDDGVVYVGCVDHMLYAVRPNGGLQWKYRTGGPILSSPAIGGDGTIYVGSGDGRLYAINSDGGLLWIHSPGGSDHGPGTIDSSPAVASDGTIYVGSTYPHMDFHAIGPDGTTLWGYRTYGDVESSPAIDGNGIIYVGSIRADSGALFAFEPDGTLAWEYDIGSHVNTSPAIGADGTVYVGSANGYLNAIG